jgi:hypothetical protein
MYGCHDEMVSLQYYDAYFVDLTQLMALATRVELARAVCDALASTRSI